MAPQNPRTKTAKSSKVSPAKNGAVEPVRDRETGPRVPALAPANLNLYRESFDNIFLDLSKESGKCRFADNGFGWKPSGGGDTFTLDGAQIANAQWSRAAKGYEVKILSRSSGIVQLDGFVQEV